MAHQVQTYSRAANLAQDALSSIKTIHAFGAETRLVKWYNDYLEKAHKDGNKKSAILGVLFASQPFLVMAGTALAFWEGYRLFQHGEVGNVGTVFTAVLSVTLGATSVLLFLPQLGPITNAASAASELFAVMDKPSILDPLSSSGKQPLSCAGHIELRDVHFSYPSRPTVPVLQGLNLTLPQGKTTALVGPSGCGKSTVVGLLEQWYQPTSGSIFLDGCHISELNTKWLRSNVRLVQQEPTLFQGTVFENIAKGFIAEQLDLPSEKQRQLVREACITADAHGFIEQLPKGYDTALGERANNLSGGQRQRLCIARSILSNPKILLCDEATSALDPRAEKVVQDALDHVTKGKTTLVIAHKIKTIMAADNIIVIANGKVHEQGTHGQLVERDDLYAAMVRAQDLNTAPQNVDGSHEGHQKQSSVDTTTSDNHHHQTELVSSVTEFKKKPQTLQSVGYSLFTCIFLMLKEHSDLYYLYGILMVAQLIVGATYPTQSILLSRLIRAFTKQGSEGTKDADFYSLMFFILALANLFGSFVIGMIANRIGQTLTHRYRYEMFERVLALDQNFFDCHDNTSGALTAKLSSVPSAVQDLMCANFGLLVKVMVNVIASAVLGIAFGWKLGLVMVFAGLFVIVGSGYLRIHLDRKIEVSAETQFAKSASLAAETVSAIKTVSALTLEESVLLEYSQTLDQIVTDVKRNLVSTFLCPTLQHI